MLAEKIEGASAALAEMAGTVSQDQWSLLRRIRAELDDAAETARWLEKNLHVPEAGPAGALARTREIRKRLEGRHHDG